MLHDSFSFRTNNKSYVESTPTKSLFFLFIEIYTDFYNIFISISVTSKLERLCFDIVALRSFEFRDWGHKHCNSNALRFCYLIVVYVPSL